MIYLLDSNVYIHGFRDHDFGERMRNFHWRNLPRLMLSVVVMHELLVGAANTKKEKALLNGLVEPFRIRRRVHVPGRRTWVAAATVDRRLRLHHSFQSRLRTRSFANDLLIAASARELGATIVTENRDDFEIIGSVLDIRFTEPFP